MTGDVLLDSVADREPDYWLWQIKPGDDMFLFFGTIHHALPTGDDEQVETH